VAENEHEQDGVLWRALLAESPDVVLVVDPEGTIQYSNRDKFTFRGQHVIGRKMWDFAVGDAEVRLRSKLQAVIDTRKAIRYEYPGYDQEGELAWYEVRAVPVLVSGKVDRIIWASSDITPRWNAQQRLEMSEQRFRALVEHGNDCIVMSDDKGTITYTSPAFSRFLGYAAEELLGRPAIEFIHADDRGAAYRAGRGAVAGAITATTLRLLHKDGSWRTFTGTSVNLLDDPAVRAVVGNVRDVTDQRAEEERIAFQAHILREVSQPILATTPDDVLVFWNHAAERTFGWTTEEALGRKGSELLQAQGDFDAVVRSMSESGGWQGGLGMRTKSGEPVSVEASIRVLFGADGKPSLGLTVMNDVTARMSLEEQLRQSQKMEAIGLLAGGVAHDFNNLLAVILGFSELASRKLPPGHPVALQLAEVFDAARRGGELTRKLLAFSRKQIIQPRPIELGATVTDFTRLLSRVVGEDVELAIERAPEGVVVRADAVQLEQVLLNLCTNARQAMPQGGKLTLTTRTTRFDGAQMVRQAWARAGAFGELAVSDTGIGMDQATVSRVFEPFFTTKREGTGLGLATVYGIVQQHGGFVRVESAPGAGTTFRVFFPLAADVAAVSARPPSDPSRKELRGTETILVAEDEPSLRTLVSTTLSELGYRVVATADGEEAVREYERSGRSFAMVLLDVVMPRLDAREAYERISAIHPDVKVLFMTGYAPESTRLAELIETGRVPVLEKPFTPQALAAKVRSVIDR
jgi:two-component system cell cycle sensor histidine kinase/response regulator CckA